LYNYVQVQKVYLVDETGEIVAYGDVIQTKEGAIADKVIAKVLRDIEIDSSSLRVSVDQIIGGSIDAVEVSSV